MSWQIGMCANAVIGVAYLCIAMAIAVPLARTNQLRSNPLGAATAAIFLTCAVHHGSHAVHMLLPFFVSDPQGQDMRAAWDWPLALWDVVGAVVAVYYLSLRRGYSALVDGAQLFDDLRRREQQALELNDTVLQGMVVAQMALDLDDPDRARVAITGSIDAASGMITALLADERFRTRLVRGSPAQPIAGATGTAGGDT